MPIELTITLSDEDLQRFQDSIDKGEQLLDDSVPTADIERAAAELIDKARSLQLPEFIAERLLKLQVLLNMIQDSEWQLTDAECRSIHSVLYYFIEPNDVIPDDIPGIGYLDDALYAELVCQQLSHEINSYQEFCKFRTSEETRRKISGLDTHVGREDWIASKRAQLHARMRERRTLAKGGRGFRMRLVESA